MANIYQRAKIYKIYSLLGDKIYIGSTCKKTLNERFSKHKSNYKCYLKNKIKTYTTSYELFDLYGIANCNIMLLEAKPCISKLECHSIEGEYIRKLDCVNISRPCISKEENKIYHQQYKKDNKIKIITYMKKYNNEHIIIAKYKQQLKQHKKKIKKLDLKFQSYVDFFTKI